MLDRGEDETLDFKQQVTSENKIAKTIVSFANHIGGILLIGVDDQKRIRGIHPEEEKFMLEKAAGFYCKPEIPIEIKEWQVGKKIILEVHISKGEHKPYFALGDDDKWWAYIRVRDESLLASKVVVEVLKREAEDKNTVIQYTSKEKALLDHLAEHQRITLKEYMHLVNISRRRATGILVNMISVGVIRVHTHEKTEFYTLSSAY